VFTRNCLFNSAIHRTWSCYCRDCPKSHSHLCEVFFFYYLIIRGYRCWNRISAPKDWHSWIFSDLEFETIIPIKRQIGPSENQRGAQTVHKSDISSYKCVIIGQKHTLDKRKLNFLWNRVSLLLAGFLKGGIHQMWHGYAESAHIHSFAAKKDSGSWATRAVEKAMESWILQTKPTT
jgi:hypothetical protein